MATFGRIAGVLAGARDRARTLEQEQKAQQQADQQRTLQMAALEAGLREQGIIPAGEMQNIELPGLTLAGAPPTDRPDVAPQQTLVRDPSRYQTLGDTGRVLDTTRSPSAIRAKAEEAAARRAAQQEAEKHRRAIELEEVRARLKPQTPTRLNTVTLADGVWAIDPSTGEKVRRIGDPRPQAAGTGGGGRPPAEGERKALFYFRRAQPAAEIMNRFDNVKALDDLASKAGMFGNWAKTAEGRQLFQAGQVWAMAVLRQDSGGAITDAEMDNYFATYLPKPGDDEATLAQKREARRVVTEGLRELAGRALPHDDAPDVSQDAPQNPWR